MSPYYSLQQIKELAELKSAGKNWMGQCPKCGKMHLSISKRLGIYHCFTPGCDCDGILTDYLQGDAPGGRGATMAPMARPAATKEKPGGMVPMIPADYRSLPDKVLQEIHPLQSDADESLSTCSRAVVQYLQKQGIDLQTAIDMRLCYARHRCYDTGDKQGRECDCLVYVNYVGGNPVNAKYRSAVGKLFSQESPTTPCPPYNIDCINPLLVEEDCIDRLIVVEGEKDTLTLRQAGYRYVVSVSNGAATDVDKCFEAFAPWLEAVREVVICGDADQPGRTLQQHLTDYFGSRALVATLPGGCKDISEVMQHYGIEAVREVVDSARYPYSGDIVGVDDIRSQVLDRLHGIYDHGYNLGYGPLTDGVLHLTDQGGLIIVTGKPNAGKTDWLNDVCAHIIFKCHRRVCMCSFEVPDKAAHTSKLVQLGLGRADTTHYSDADLRPFIDYLDAHVSHIDTDSFDPTPENILSRAEQVHRRTPLNMLVVDPYMFLNLGTAANETMAIKRMLTQFQTWGRRNHVWVTVVAHPRKLNKLSGSNDLEKIDMYTIAGSANWANLADFIISVSRIRDAEADEANADSRKLDYTRVDVLKVRDQDMCSTGSVLYRRQPCGRYDERPDRQTIEEEILGNGMPARDTMPWL